MREHAVVADPRTGRKDMGQLEGGALCHGPVLGNRVLASGSRGHRPVVRSFRLDMRGRPRVFAAGDQVVPSASPGRLGVAQTESSRGELAFESLREVRTSGRTVYRVRRRLPPWSALQAAVAGGLIFTRRSVLERWHPRTGRMVRRLPDAWMIAAGRTRLASCSEGCGALQVSTATSDRLLRPPAGMRLPGTSGAFSPDGARLALPVMREGNWQVAVVDLETGRWNLVPRARLSGYRSIAGSPSGEWLYFTRRGSRILAWRQRSPRPRRLPVRPGGTVVSIATAPASG
jgi:hypothetical protein